MGPAERSGRGPPVHRRLVHGQDWRLGREPDPEDAPELPGQDAVQTIQQVRRRIDTDNDTDVGDDVDGVSLKLVQRFRVCDNLSKNMKN